ncbi:hypothetical protein [Brucella intermedia]|uniref:hypothetical protein n=1 Tax=Brucella intermedia TaxID=94625 RepID=UPI0004694810|nr:hypothetical protein [Brucella intermedia]
MASKELTNDVAIFLRNISVSSDNGGSYDEYECKEKAQELLSTILAALLEPDQSMLGAAEDICVDGPYLGRLDADLVWVTMLAASALGEQSE